MVDYTKPAMRDESWRRWKGGKKLADQLRVFYTSKSALDRIAWHNANAGLSASSGKLSPNGDIRSAVRREALKAFLGGEQRGQQRGWPGIQARAQAAVASATSPSLPGKDSPSR